MQNVVVNFRVCKMLHVSVFLGYAENPRSPSNNYKLGTAFTQSRTQLSHKKRPGTGDAAEKSCSTFPVQ